ncbi:MAG: hypothetical protein ACE5J9_08345, partial [Methanosarcinales archaeon]
MEKLIFDTGHLITCGKYQIRDQYLMDIVTGNFKVIIPEVVKKEAIDYGKPRNDAFVIEEYLNAGKINIEVVDNLNEKQKKLLDACNLKNGDRAVVELYYSKNIGNVVVDDHVLYFYLDRLGIPKKMFPDLIKDLVVRSKIDKEHALQILEIIKTRY